MSLIHPTAIISERAQIHQSVSIGPYTVVGDDVSIGAHTRIGSHCLIEGPTTIGSDNRIYSHAALGLAPQDKKYNDEPTQLIIGNGNTIREFVTFSRGTAQDSGITSIGDQNWIMASCHIAHDCEVGNHTIMANGASLAGHVMVDDYAILGGFVTAHQFTRIGYRAFVSLQAVVRQDIPAYVMAEGHPVKGRAINTEGLKRAGYSSDDIALIKRAYKLIYRSGQSIESVTEALSQWTDTNGVLVPMIDSIKASTRGLAR